jgi:2-C-methyl-D-erythritol 4-phosphate cytidylyltransferase
MERRRADVPVGFLTLTERSPQGDTVTIARRPDRHDHVWAIVLAAGGGTRFGGPKQFATAAGHRLVDLALETAAATCDHVVLVLPAGHRWDGRPVDAVVPGGVDRRGSVRRGLSAIPDTTGRVLVHQAANPLATTDTVERLLDAVAAGAAAAVPGWRPSDLVRRVEHGTLGEIVGRDELVLVQCPAAFRLEVLRRAHATDGDALEDTALVTAAGDEVQVVPGDPRNVHVASPADLEIVTALLRERQR